MLLNQGWCVSFNINVGEKINARNIRHLGFVGTNVYLCPQKVEAKLYNKISRESRLYWFTEWKPRCSIEVFSIAEATIIRKSHLLSQSKCE